jgi:hypothetical protein
LVTLGSPGFRAGKSPAFLVFPRAGPVRAVAGEEAGHEDLQQERGEDEVGLVRGKAATVSVAAARACGKLIRSGDARRVDGDAGELSDGLENGERRSHLLHDALGVAGAPDGLAFSPCRSRGGR